MPPTLMKLTTMRDARIANVEALGGGEGFSVFAGAFDGLPAVFIDCSTLNDLLDEDDQITSPVTVHVFADEEERDAYIETMRRTRPDAIGVNMAERKSRSNP